MPQDKAYLRKAALAKRAALPAAEYEEYSDAACQKLMIFIQESSASSIIAGYNAVKGELDVVTVLSDAALKYETVLPVVSAQTKILQFYPWKPGEALIQNKYHIHEPAAREQAVTPDIVVVPLLAFDRSGHRLGYGAGYYDATLQHLRGAGKKIIAIGVAFAIQEVSALPAEAHDQTLDVIVTEKEIIRINK